MKKTLLVIGLTAAVLAWMPGSAQERREFSSYQDMREYLGELFGQKKYAQAAALLESVLDRFPEHVLPNTYNLALARLFQGDAGKTIEALEEGHRRGIFYGIWDFAAPPWDEVRAAPRFEAFLKENRVRLEAAQSRASLKIETVMPSSYDPTKKHPLFIALHGGGESVADFKPLWTSPRLRGEFLTVYVQSSQVASMKGFHWQDIAVTRRDLEAAYRRILEQYPVDTGRVVIGGFSSGGFGSLVAALKNVLPVRGFVVLCPEVPTTISDEDILSARARGLRGTLLSTEADNRVDLQRSLITRMEKLGLPAVFHLTPKIGHWYPEDFENLLDRALGHIFEPGRQPSAPARPIVE